MSNACCNTQTHILGVRTKENGVLDPKFENRRYKGQLTCLRRSAGAVAGRERTSPDGGGSCSRDGDRLLDVNQTTLESRRHLSWRCRLRRWCRHCDAAAAQRRAELLRAAADTGLHVRKHPPTTDVNTVGSRDADRTCLN